MGGVPASNFAGAFCPCAAFEQHLGDHLAAAEERRHRVEQRAARPQGTHAVRSEKLVAAEGIEIDAKGGDVDGAVRDTLRAVEQHARAGRLGRSDDRGHVEDGTCDVRDVGKCHQLRARAEQAGQGSGIDPAFRRDRQEPQHDARARGQHLPRHEVGVMLKRAEDDLVARLQQRTEGVRDQIDRPRATAREHDLVGRHGQIRRHARTRLRIGFGRGFGQPVHTAFHVCPRIRLEIPHGVEHGVRHLRACRTVEIGKPVAQDREFGPERVQARFPLPARNAASASGVSRSSRTPSSSISTSHTASSWRRISARAPWSPSRARISSK